MRTFIIVFSITLVMALLTITGFIANQAIDDPPTTPISGVRFKDGNYNSVPDSEAGWRPRTNMDITERAGTTETRIFTDDRGARVDGPGMKGARQVGLVVVGCSQAWGQGNDNADTFGGVAAKLLNSNWANYAVYGYGTVGSLAILKANIDQKPKVVLYGFWEDHLNRNVFQCASIDADPCLKMPTVTFAADGSMAIKPVPDAEASITAVRRWYIENSSQEGNERTFWTTFYWTGFRLWRRLEERLYGPYNDPANKDPVRQAKAAAFALDEMAKTAASGDGHLIVVWIPLYFDETINPAPQWLLEAAEKGGYAILDMTDDFYAMRKEKVGITIPGDGHLSKASHARIGEKAVALIRERGWM